MFTFKEALCLLAIVVAYGIAGQLDFEDQHLLAHQRLPAGEPCLATRQADGHPPTVGQASPPPAGHPSGFPQADEDCLRPRLAHP